MCRVRSVTWDFSRQGSVCFQARAIGGNERVKGVCKEGGGSFMDEWDRLLGRREVYAWDGVHLSRRGIDGLSECLERAVGRVCRG